MHSRPWVVGVLLALGAGPAAADITFRATGEAGLLLSPKTDGRRDTAAFFDAVPSLVVRLDPRWQLAVGVGLPAAPLLNVQLPIVIERGAVKRGALLRLAARPMLASIALCSDGGSCPLNAAASPQDRGGLAAGIFGEVGFGYRLPVTATWRLDLRAGFVGGTWFYRGGDHEDPLAGIWNGFTVGIDFTL